MTDEQTEKLVAAKAEVSQWLRDVNLRQYRLERVDPRLRDYVKGVAKNPEGHNLWEQLAVRRFLGMCDKYKINAKKVQRFYRFYEFLHFPGKAGLTRFELTPVQCFQFASIYGFWKDGHRVVKEACLFVPRKFSKTTGTASIAVYDLMCGEANAEAYVGANSQDQAKKCFDVIRSCMRKLDPNERFYTINELTVKSRRSDTSAFAQCLTANARTKDGLNASVVIMDEFSQARDNAFLTVLTTSMGVRDNPLTVIITTASDVIDGPFYAMLQGYKQVLLGEIEDDSLFAHLFEPDVGDEEGDEKTWLKVQPHMGVTVSLDFYRQEFKNASRNGAQAMLAFRTKLLNIFTEEHGKSWIPMKKIKACMKPLNPLMQLGKPKAMIAVDLSVKDDFSAVTTAWYDSRRDKMNFHTAYFFPEGSLPNHPNERLYRAWAHAGKLILCKGNVIDYSQIVDYILRINDEMLVLNIGYDPAHSREFFNQLAAHQDAVGVENCIKAVRQNYVTFTAPVESLEYGVETDRVAIDDNPITTFCFGNAVLDVDKNGTCKPQKRGNLQSLKIDGVITMLMCYRLWLDVLNPVEDED